MWRLLVVLSLMRHAAEAEPCFRSNAELRQAVQAYLENDAAQNRTPIGDWCVDDVTDFSYVFKDAVNFNEAGIQNWRMDQAVSLRSMFQGATSFNQPLDHWNVSGVRDFSFMFEGAKQFAQTLDWDTSAALTMRGMFANASAHAVDFSSFDVSQVTDLSYMFQHSRVTAFNLGKWRPVQVQTLSHFMESAADFNFHGVVPWDTPELTDLSYAFMNAALFDGDLSGWNVERVVTMEAAFHTAVGFQGIGLEGWRTYNLQNLAHSFQDTWHFSADLSQWSTEYLTDLTSTFSSASAFNSDISSWSVGSVVSFNDTFRGATSFSQNLCPWGQSLKGHHVTFVRTFSQTACPSTQSPIFKGGLVVGSLCHPCGANPIDLRNDEGRLGNETDTSDIHDANDGNDDNFIDDSVPSPRFSDNDDQPSKFQVVMRDIDMTAILLALCAVCALLGCLIRRRILRQRIHRRHLEVYSQVQPYDMDDAVELTSNAVAIDKWGADPSWDDSESNDLS